MVGWKKEEKKRDCVRSRDLHSTISHSFHHLVCHLCYLATFQIDCTRLLLSAPSPHIHWTGDKCRLGLIGTKLKIQAHYLENIKVLSCKPLTAMSFKSEGPCESCEQFLMQLVISMDYPPYHLLLLRYLSSISHKVYKKHEPPPLTHIDASKHLSLHARHKNECIHAQHASLPSPLYWYSWKSSTKQSTFKAAFFIRRQEQNLNWFDLIWDVFTGTVQRQKRIKLGI